MKNPEKYCYIFDYSIPAIYEIKLDKDDENISANEILDRRGLRESDCSYMFTNRKLSVKRLNSKDDESVSD